MSGAREINVGVDQQMSLGYLKEAVAVRTRGRRRRTDGQLLLVHRLQHGRGEVGGDAGRRDRRGGRRGGRGRGLARARLTDLPPEHRARAARHRTQGYPDSFHQRRARRDASHQAAARGLRPFHDGTSLRRAVPPRASAANHPRSVRSPDRSRTKRRHQATTRHVG